MRLGQVLIIPVIENESPKENVYIVQKGDTLYKIAQNYDTTVGDIIRLNNLTNTSLSIGQILEIPTTNSIQTYIVQRGDTLYKIAQNYNTTVDELKRLNNLTSDILSIGQELNLPVEASTEKTTYTVQRGDTLYRIAQNYNTTVDELKRLNNLTSNTLSIGQILKIK